MKPAKRQMLRIALPKGRMSEETLDFFLQRSLFKNIEVPTGRELIFSDPDDKFQFLLIRSKDVGRYVEQGAADFGVIGADLLAEHNFILNVASSLPLGYCRLSVAHAREHTSWKQKRNLKVATKYPNITSRYFFYRGYNIEIIELYGSIEIAPITGISDVITDLVSTGSTLKANGLLEEDTIMESSARLVANRVSYITKRETMNKVIDILS